MHQVGKFGALRGLRTLAAAAVFLGASLTAPAVQTALADSRCSGHGGITVWEGSNLNGASATWCTDTSNYTRLEIPILDQKKDNLGWYATWNDRISSVQTFNTISSGEAILVQNNWWLWTDASRNYNVFGNTTVMYVGNSANDQASSLMMSTTGRIYY